MKNFKQNKLKFIDLFAGLGGFHLALNQLGHECVFACELDKQLQTLYKKNFKLEPKGDIREISIEKEIPSHDVLCGGFPCQPFSKAGSQNGFQDPQSGDLFYYIIKILEHHRPKYFILENVANFQRHNKGETWSYAKAKLENLGYSVDINKLSPHYFGIPQIRERVIIVGSLDGLDHFKWPVKYENVETNIKTVLDENPDNARKISKQVLECFDVWQQFLDLFPSEQQLPSFPIWAMEFGATYPYEDTTPYALSEEELSKYKGSFGKKLKDKTKEEIFSLLPSYARKEQLRFPDWKIDFIRKNREFYKINKKWIDKWKKNLYKFPQSFQKFEWNCRGEEKKLRNYVIQTRASGVRIKRSTTAPSLVALSSTQVPIIGWEERYMTPKECARLQSMDSLMYLPETPTKAYKALGNAVNVKVIRNVAENLFLDPCKDE